MTRRRKGRWVDVPEGYNGYANRATWAVALHIANDEGLYLHWRARAAECAVARRILNEPDAGSNPGGRWALEEELGAWFDEVRDSVVEVLEKAMPADEPRLLVQDLLPDRGSVNWREVAESVMED